MVQRWSPVAHTSASCLSIPELFNCGNFLFHPCNIHCKLICLQIPKTLFTPAVYWYFLKSTYSYYIIISFIYIRVEKCIFLYNNPSSFHNAMCVCLYIIYQANKLSEPCFHYSSSSWCLNWLLVLLCTSYILQVFRSYLFFYLPKTMLLGLWWRSS